MLLTSRLLILIGMMISGSVPSFGAAPKHAWKFTNADYSSLKKSGQDLQFDSDSEWLPASFAKALVTTLRWALDEQRSPQVTDEVSLLDFYHGHIACHKSKVSPELAEEVRAFASWQRQHINRTLGPERNDVDTAILPEFSSTVREINQGAGQLLRTMEKRGLCSSVVILFHTRENNMPSTWAFTDPRRTLVTPVSNPIPRRFKLRVPGNAASNFCKEYLEIMQISFLIDRSGNIHVVSGSKAGLTPLLGRPFVDEDFLP